MRWFAIAIIALAAAAAGCGGDSTACDYMGSSYERGAVFPAGDGCNTCSCTEQGVECTAIDCSTQPDANPAATCGPSGGCPVGPPCGGGCCGIGEQCVAGQCLCGDGPPCTGDDHCESFGPLPESFCGSVCCSTDCPQ